MLPKKGAAYVDISASSLRSEAMQSVSSDLILEFIMKSVWIKRRLIYGLSYANAPESTVRCYYPQTFYTGLRLFN